MITKTFANYERNAEGRYVRNGDLVLSVIKTGSVTPKLRFIRNDAAKEIKILEDLNGYIYRIKKTAIYADGGLDGFYEFLKREAAEPGGGFMLTIFDRVFDYMK